MAATKKKRETLGNMTLKENSTCAEMAEDEEEAAKLLKDNLTSGEAGSSWAKRQSHLKRKIDAKKNMNEVERRKKVAGEAWVQKVLAHQFHSESWRGLEKGWQMGKWAADAQEVLSTGVRTSYTKW